MSDQSLEILHQDQTIVVVNKPGGLLAVPGRGPGKQDCVVNRLRRRFPEMISQPAVHRLDMMTSGLMVVAMTAAAHRELNRQFQERRVDKVYEALVMGRVRGDAGEIGLRFRLDPDDRPRQIYDPQHGKLGLTRWQVLTRDETATRVRFQPLTGRTHQLRLHAAHPLGLGCPILGDSLYGGGQEGDALCLCAVRLGFTHPGHGRFVVFHLQPPF